MAKGNRNGSKKLRVNMLDLVDNINMQFGNLKGILNVSVAASSPSDYEIPDDAIPNALFAARELAQSIQDEVDELYRLASLAYVNAEGDQTQRTPAVGTVTA